MQKRIFIAINLPDELKDKLSVWRKKQGKLRVGWTKPENMHITLAFAGEIGENKIGKILKTAAQTAKNFNPFEISVNRIHTRFAGATARRVGPNPDMPRMIWLSGPKNKNLSGLARQLACNLQKAGIKLNNNHGFKLHITLARARNDELRGVRIDEKFNHSFIVKSAEVMESKLMPGGPEYKVLESIKL